jgi:carboxylate-amine ligase
MKLCGAGSHRFSGRLALISPVPRYRRLGKVAGYLGHNQITFATHVHIGMRSGDEAIAAMCALKPDLPILIAVSANSPFWRRYETGYASYRLRILAAARSYGLPPSFEDWGQFCEFFETAQGVVGYQRQQRIYHDTGSLKQVVETLVQELCRQHAS